MNETSDSPQIPSTGTGPDYTWPFGTRHKRTRRLIGALIILLFLMPILFLCFEGEPAAAIWHLRNGKSFEYEGVRFKIPASQYVNCWSPHGCTVLQTMGYLRFRIVRPKPSSVMFSSSSSADQSQARNFGQLRANAMHWPLVAERSVAMAGDQVRCLDYLQTDGRTHTINCYSNATPIHITYIGSGDSVFLYELLSTASRR